MNKGKTKKPTTSSYKGVSQFRKKWVAWIGIDGKNKYLGLFLSEVEAAKAYDDAARELFGEYAKCNF
jgi:hypothetical protein